MGRPTHLPDNTVIAIDGETARAKLQRDSDRRAVINHLIDKGGSAPVKAINEHFGYDTRPVLLRLMKSGWLKEVTA